MVYILLCYIAPEPSINAPWLLYWRFRYSEY